MEDIENALEIIKCFGMLDENYTGCGYHELILSKSSCIERKFNNLLQIKDI